MKIIYVYDALCGWCYGFSPVIQKLVNDKNLECEVVSGGMITGDRIGPIGDVAGYISTAYKDVEQRSGVKFGTSFLKDILEDGRAIFTSIPAAIAMAAFKELRPASQLAFAAAIQKAIYYYGHQPIENQTYIDLAKAHGIDAHQFSSMMDDSRYRQKAEEEFKLSSKLNVNGFPTVFIVEDHQAVVITRGFADYEQLIQQYDAGVQMLQS